MTWLFPGEGQVNLQTGLALRKNISKTSIWKFSKSMKQYEEQLPIFAKMALFTRNSFQLPWGKVFY